MQGFPKSENYWEYLTWIRTACWNIFCSVHAQQDQVNLFMVLDTCKGTLTRKKSTDLRQWGRVDSTSEPASHRFDSKWEHCINECIFFRYSEHEYGTFYIHIALHSGIVMKITFPSKQISNCCWCKLLITFEDKITDGLYIYSFAQGSKYLEIQSER